MANLRAKFWVVFALLLLTPSLAMASGFRIPDQGARAMGMANAATAQSGDASCLYHNPAAAGTLDGTYSMWGVTLIDAEGADFNSKTPGLPDEISDDQLFFPPHFYFVSDFGLSKFNFGLATTSPFGLSRDWDEPTGFQRRADRVDLHTANVQGSLTYEVMDNLYVAAFIQVMQAKVNLEAAPQFTFGPFGLRGVDEIDLTADGTGWGMGASVYWKPCDPVTIGAIYRSGITVDLDGKAEANRIFPALQGLAGGRSAFETDLRSVIHFPSTAALGISYKINDQLTVEYDLDYTGWHSFKDLPVHLGQELSGISFTNAALSATEDWHDTYTHRFGAQYTFNETWKARIGYAYDPTPIPNHTVGPVLPDSNRHDLAFGVGYASGHWDVDLAYMAVFFESRDVRNSHEAPQIPVQDGTYDNFAQLLAISIGYKY